MLRVAVIGYGGIVRDTIDVLKAASGAQEPIAIVGALVREGRSDNARRELPGVEIVETVYGLLGLDPKIVVEAAGQGAVTAHGERILRGGSDLLVVSVGALAASGVLDRLKESALEAGTRIILPAGAIAGIDALAAMKLRGLKSVRYRGVKPPDAWRGSLVEQHVNLADLRARTVLFEGNARDAALAYPANANVAATVALAGLGFDATRVELVADPAAQRNRHEIEAEGESGRLMLLVEGVPSASNPKTSALTALSVARTLLNATAAIVI